MGWAIQAEKIKFAGDRFFGAILCILTETNHFFRFFKKFEDCRPLMSDWTNLMLEIHRKKDKFDNVDINDVFQFLKLRLSSLIHSISDYESYPGQIMLFLVTKVPKRFNLG